MKQITIYEFLKKNEGVIKDGWVAFNGESWAWFSEKPELDKNLKILVGGFVRELDTFYLKPAKCNWKDSLIKVEHKCSSKCTSSGQVKEEE